jgi:myo-inositol-1(or 4)-monophosphatase
MSELEPKLADLEELARAAGEILREGFGSALQVENKGAIDLVTQVDKEAEAFLLQQISERFPESQALGEEGGRLSGAGEGKWFIDPIDGTTNFAHGLPIFCVSIGYAKADELLLGVVYNPIHEELYKAERGDGAQLNEKSIHVNQVESVGDSMLVTGFPYDIRTNPDNNLAEYARFALRTHGVRRLGAAALDLCYVAAGYVDGYWEKSIKPWDIAAGALIVQEAGGLVTDINGNLDFMSQKHILAANPTLHAEMLKLLHQED